MRAITIRNVPDEVHRALRVQAALHGRSAEAEVRAILGEAVKPQGRIKLGSLLAGIGRQAGLEDEDFAAFERDRTPHAPVSLEPIHPFSPPGG